MSFQRLSERDEDGDPDEFTRIATARDNSIDYQSTRVSPNPRNRRRTQQSEIDHPETNEASQNADEEKHWLKQYFGGLWSIDLENKGSVARDHLALGACSWGPLSSARALSFAS